MEMDSDRDRRLWVLQYLFVLLEENIEILAAAICHPPEC